MRALLVVFTLLTASACFAQPNARFIQKQCNQFPGKLLCAHLPAPTPPGYNTWTWFNPDARRLVMALNRRNTLIWNGHLVVIPHAIGVSYDYNSYSTLPRYVEELSGSDKAVLVDLKELSWGAYQEGWLVNWGPANGGSKRCKESGKLACKTPVGLHKVLQIYGAGKKSTLYPTDCQNSRVCGFKMPYFMKVFPDGAGLHGARWLPGYNASHGCVRLFTEDAKWLATSFVVVGTPVLVRNY